jgi:hypothetical protein
MSDTIFRRKLSTLGRVVQERGIGWLLRAEAEKAAIWVLAKRYSFRASWHPPTFIRPYRAAIADAVNALNPEVVCEVGCGLGSILTRLKAPTRIGYDIEPGVVKAARLIRSNTIEFREGSIRDVTVPRMDVLILVNWIHEVAPEDLQRDLMPLLGKTKYLVVDAIDPDVPGYRYKHDFAFLKQHMVEVGRFRMPAEPRSFVTYQTR